MDSTLVLSTHDAAQRAQLVSSNHTKLPSAPAGNTRLAHHTQLCARLRHWALRHRPGRGRQHARSCRLVPNQPQSIVSLACNLNQLELFTIDMHFKTALSSTFPMSIFRRFPVTCASYRHNHGHGYIVRVKKLFLMAFFCKIPPVNR